MANDSILRTPMWVTLAAVVVGGLFYLGGKQIEVDDRDDAVISVSGEGKAFVVPDISQVSFGVNTGRQPTAERALAVLKERITAAHDAVVKLGIEPKDIRTENFWLNPVYDWTQDRGQIFRGFEANQSMRVKVRDLDKVSTVLEAATKAGANQAGGVEFTVDDPEAKRAEARQKAIAQAKEKAENIARDLGVRLGELKGFNESGPWGSTMMRAEGMGGGGDMAAAVPSTIPLPPGEQELHVSVTLTFELD